MWSILLCQKPINSLKINRLICLAALSYFSTIFLFLSMFILPVWCFIAASIFWVSISFLFFRCLSRFALVLFARRSGEPEALGTASSSSVEELTRNLLLVLKSIDGGG